MTRRDRTGEPEPTETEHRCDHGWIDADADQPRPCLHCRPWLRNGAVNITDPARKAHR